MPVASASVPMVRPSSPALLTRRSASSRMAARVRSPFVLMLPGVTVVCTAMAGNNSTNVRICQCEPPATRPRVVSDLEDVHQPDERESGAADRDADHGCDDGGI